MGETGGKMLFTPARIEVKQGEKIKLCAYGELDDQFILATIEDKLEHAEAMK